MEHKNIVILGAGFGGIRVALDLENDLPSGYQIVLIDKNSYHQFSPVLYELATAFMPKQKRLDFKNLKGSANIKLADIFKNRSVEVLMGDVVSLDLKQQKINLNSANPINFSYLVIALGSETEYYQIPGAKEFSTPLKSANDALNLRDSIEEKISQINENQKFKVVIVGGGSTGCELAAELTGFFKRLDCIFEVSIIEAADKLLGQINNAIGKQAKKRLNRLGVKIDFNCQVQKVEQNKVIAKDGHKIGFDILIWTAGVRAPQLNISDLPVEEKKDRIKVENDLSVLGFKNIFALGDNSFCYQSVSGGYPQTAQIAIDQAKVVAKNILNKINAKPGINFEKSWHPFVVPLGGKYALADLKFIKFSGVLAWILKELIELKYLLSILPVGRALRIWWQGVKLYQSND